MPEGSAGTVILRGLLSFAYTLPQQMLCYQALRPLAHVAPAQGLEIAHLPQGGVAGMTATFGTQMAGELQQGALYAFGLCILWL